MDIPANNTNGSITNIDTTNINTPIVISILDMIKRVF